MANNEEVVVPSISIESTKEFREIKSTRLPKPLALVGRVGSKLFSPRKRGSPTGSRSPKESCSNIEIIKLEVISDVVVQDDSLTYFMIHTSYASRFRAVFDYQFNIQLKKNNITLTELGAMGHKFQQIFAYDNHICFYAPFPALFEIPTMLQTLNVAHVTGYSSVVRYVNNETKEVLLNLTLKCEEIAKNTTNDTCDETENMDDEAKLEIIRKKYARFLKGEKDITSTDAEEVAVDLFPDESK